MLIQDHQLVLKLQPSSASYNICTVCIVVTPKMEDALSLISKHTLEGELEFVFGLPEELYATIDQHAGCIHDRLEILVQPGGVARLFLEVVSGAKDVDDEIDLELEKNDPDLSKSLAKWIDTWAREIAVHTAPGPRRMKWSPEKWRDEMTPILQDAVTAALDFDRVRCTAATLKCWSIHEQAFV